MQAMAKITTSGAEVRVRPAPSNSGGASTRPSATASSGRRMSRRMVSGLQPLEAFAQEATRADQEDEEHQEVDRGLLGRRIELDGEPAHHADDDGGQHHTPEAAEAADHHDDEGSRDHL